MSFEIGENVGAYRVMEKLGRGGMATVYKAYHANLDRYVALKVLHPAFLEDPNFLARFQREARLVAKLEHPNIVPVYDFADHEEQPYLVMKYIEGETLKARLNRGRLEPDEIWKVVESVGAGLGYAHKQGILHRDIKPSNVIMAKNGTAYLADFGLARIAQSGESTLSSDMIMGTPQYISPEQAKGEKDLDNRTDIYSFAVMLYEMVVGQVPFSSDTPFSIIHDHIYSPLPLPHLVNPNVPDEVERVLLKALAKERADRYESVEALTSAFKKAWDDADVDIAEATMTTPLHQILRPASAPPPADPVHSSTTPTIAPEKEKKEEKKESLASTIEKPKKKFPIWTLIASGVLLILACIILLSALRDSRVDMNLATKKSGFSEQDEERAGRPGNQPSSPEIEEARAWVQDSPDDPYARLTLSLALLDAKQISSAYEMLDKAVDLAGDDTNFYYDAGYDLMDREAWMGATIVFMRALQEIPSSSPDTPELTNLFHENLYRVASMPEMPTYIPLDEIAQIDEPMMKIAEARHALYHGNPEDASRLLDELNRIEPNMPEARLLEAEMLVRDKKKDEARPIFESLMNDEHTPDWIFFIAEESLEKIP